MTSQGSDNAKRPVVLAAAAHPDDIEFMMAGTLLRLREAGAKLHMWNLANGCCGSAVHTKEAIILLRWTETLESASLAGATVHPPLVDDFRIVFKADLTARVGAVLRDIRPDILLIPSPQDYMEDHENACRLLVTAAFVRGMRNYHTDPPALPWEGPVTIYHAQPHGLRDGLRRLVRPGQYVDIGPVHDLKRKMLAAHKTQKEWLDESQGMDAYLKEMERMSREVGALSDRFEFAEGWRRHHHLGYCAKTDDPLTDLLGEGCWTDPKYERSLG